MVKWLETGLQAAETPLFRQQEIWSTYSDDKPDIAIKSVEALRCLIRGMDIGKPLKIMSVGCGVEPQLRLFNAHGNGGVYLMDCDTAALDVLREKKTRQNLQRVSLLEQDYTLFTDTAFAEGFCREQLGGGVDAVFFHHSLYYLEAEKWLPLLLNVYHKFLLPGGVIHCVVMSNSETRPTSTTWLYNHFAGRFCGHANNQDLQRIADIWPQDSLASGCRIWNKESLVNFYCPDFFDFMAVVWMIMLYPQVHDFSLPQREEITTLVHENFFIRSQPLQQVQDHLFIQKTC